MKNSWIFIERFANIVVDVDFKCPAPQLQINYLYSFLGLYQHSKSVFKAVNEYALIGEATESEGERRFQKTVVFTGLDSKVFPHPVGPTNKIFDFANSTFLLVLFS